MSRRKPRPADRTTAAGSSDKSPAAPQSEAARGPVPPPRRHLWFLLVTIALMTAWIVFLAVLALKS